MTDTHPRPTNPKKACGAAKPTLSYVPTTSLYLLGLAHMDGGVKYGSHNWRESDIDARTYLDAAMRHLTAWWEGEDVAPDSGLPHLAHVMACCSLVLDAEVCGALTDNRPTPPPEGWMERITELHNALRQKQGDS